MQVFGRRRFLALVGTGVVAVAGGAAFTIHQLVGNGQGRTLRFQAVAGLPAQPFPSYASYVVSGQVNIKSGTGTVTRSVFSGPPPRTTSIALFSRSLRVTGVQQQGNTWRITGIVEDKTQLAKGEEEHVEIVLDSGLKLAQSTFFGSPIQLGLQQYVIAA